MANELQLMSRVLSDEQLVRHRGWIAVKAQALMGRYFQIPTDEAVKADILRGWVNRLQDFTREEIEKACSDYLVEYPKTRPHEGLIYNMVLADRKKRLPRPASAPQQIEASRLEPDIEKRIKIAEKIMASFRNRN